jgi:hypothetical protein
MSNIDTNRERIDQLEIDKIIRDTLDSFLHNVEINIDTQTLFSTKSSIKTDLVNVVKKNAKHYITHAVNQAYQIKFK